MASHYVKILDVADRHRHKMITPRPPADVRDRAQAAATRMGTTLNAVIVAFLRWYGGETDKLPKRPGPN